METSTPLEWESVSTGVRHDKQVLLFIHLLNMGLGWGGEWGVRILVYMRTQISVEVPTHTYTCFNKGLDTPLTYKHPTQYTHTKPSQGEQRASVRSVLHLCGV